jgi:hypothetical protein
LHLVITITFHSFLLLAVLRHVTPSRLVEIVTKR